MGVAIFEGSDTRATVHGITLCVLGEHAAAKGKEKTRCTSVLPKYALLPCVPYWPATACTQIVMCIPCHACTGTISNGFMMASIGRLLSEKLDVWRMTFCKWAEFPCMPACNTPLN